MSGAFSAGVIGSQTRATILLAHTVIMPKGFFVVVFDAYSSVSTLSPTSITSISKFVVIGKEGLSLEMQTSIAGVCSC